MSSCGVKNILQKDIFFSQSEEFVDYLSIKCPHFNYKHLPREDVKSWISQISIKTILDYIEQHLMVFTPNNPVFRKEYLCSCNSCLQLKFKECLEVNAPLCSDIPCNDHFRDLMMKTMKLTELYKFLTLLMFHCLFSLFSGSPNETLYFVKGTEKGNASENHSDP